MISDTLKLTKSLALIGNCLHCLPQDVRPHSVQPSQLSRLPSLTWGIYAVEQEAVEEGTELVSSGSRVYHAHTRENKNSLKNKTPTKLHPNKNPN